MKQCSNCKKHLELSNFTKKKANKDGLNGFCKQCLAIAKHNDYIKHKAKRIATSLRSRIIRFNDLKKKIIELKSKGCSWCNEKESCCLDFHHTNPSTKEFSISVAVTLQNKGIKTILKEIDKCIIICSNCHRKLHRKEII